MGRKKKDPNDMTLSPRERRFVEEYLVDFKGKEAWERCGFGGNPSDGAYKLLQRPQVKLGIEQGRKAISERTGLTQDEVRRELKRIAFGEEARDSDKVRALQLLGMDLGMFKPEGSQPAVTVIFDDPTARPEGYQRRKTEKDNGETEH